MVEAQQQQQQQQQLGQSSSRPKRGLIAAAFALGILSFITLYSIEFISLELFGITPSDNELKQLQQQHAILLDYQFPNGNEDQAIPKKGMYAEDGGMYLDYRFPKNDNNNDDDDANYRDGSDEATTLDQDEYEHDNKTNMNITIKSLQLQISEGIISNNVSATQINQAILQRNQEFIKAKEANTLPSSPACHPHFNHYQPNGQWNNTTKFKRILFYHARKAGGSSMNKYLVKVAKTYGIKIEWIEWSPMEEPGTKFDKEDTFYVTHLREPIDRSISHFKYNGRWPCQKLVKGDFVPTEENAYKLETWNETNGHNSKDSCRGRHTTGFKLGDCAINCYTQWFGGLNCPQWEVPMEQQYEVAMSKLLKYNLVVVIEKLRDPKYVQAIEGFFGVEGLLERGVPFCERKSHQANEENPLVVLNETRARLTELNRLDLKLYHEISDCLADGNYGHIPKWDGRRFMLDSFNFTKARIEKQRAKAAKEKAKAMSNGG
eukprot:scaffold12700_cov142-Skeletonema_menzelii.AAC.5